MTLLTVQKLRAYYRTEVYGISRTVRAVDDVSFSLFPNEIYGVAGESSCGKTTLIKVVSGTVKPPLKVHDGSVQFQFGNYAVDMLHVDPEELRNSVRWQEISYIPQGSMRELSPVLRIIPHIAGIVITHRCIH